MTWTSCEAHGCPLKIRLQSSVFPSRQPACSGFADDKGRNRALCGRCNKDRRGAHQLNALRIGWAACSFGEVPGGVVVPATCPFQSTELSQPALKTTN